MGIILSLALALFLVMMIFLMTMQMMQVWILRCMITAEESIDCEDPTNFIRPTSSGCSCRSTSSRTATTTSSYKGQRKSIHCCSKLVTFQCSLLSFLQGR